jgi:superfamily I DNA/RNA helicase
MADALIRVNHPGLHLPRLQPRPSNPPGVVASVQWNSVAEEAKGVADYVEYMVKQQGYKAGDIVILTPRRLLGYGIRDQVAAKAIMVHSFYHEEALEGDAAQKGFALLTLLADEEDRSALRWWLGHDSTSARREAYAKLRTYCMATGTAPRAALAGLADGSIVLPLTQPLVDSYKVLEAELVILRASSLLDIIDRLFPEGNDECDVLRDAALLALDHCETIDELADAVRTVATQPEMPEKGEFVRIMSLHKSKGLTSKVVIVTDCIQGLIPTENRKETPAEQAETLLEQRRLFYVALTRCTEHLVLSSVSQIDKKLAFKIGARVGGWGYSQTVPTISSQFFSELGPTAPSPIAGADWANHGYGLT